MTRRKAFSLIEIMIAVLFISIGFFGYVALHSRILHSGQRLEEREVIRAGTDFFEGIEVGRIMAGFSNSIAGTPYPVDPVVEKLHPFSTSVEGKDTTWINHYPEAYRPGLDETLELAPTMMTQPYDYTWEKR